ncbi:MAG: GNAT family N-acetyltransferase [Symploca sp. SIO1B1]|nr:GNAT family N-acetyltransferase [Symploca sp. SIO1B1]
MANKFSKGSYRIVNCESQQELDRAFTSGLVGLYQEVFAELPYEEYFSDHDVRSTFQAYFGDQIRDKIILFICLENEVIAFLTAIPFHSKWFNFQVINNSHKTSHTFSANYLHKTFGLIPNNTWYLDELGVKKHHRRQGLARELLKTCLDKLENTNMFLITQENNFQAQKLYKSLDFTIVDEQYIMISQERQDRMVREDRRIIMIKKVV